MENGDQIYLGPYEELLIRPSSGPIVLTLTFEPKGELTAEQRNLHKRLEETEQKLNRYRQLVHAYELEVDREARPEGADD